MNEMSSTAVQASKLTVRDTSRVRILFADQLNLARGKYVPAGEAAKGHARFCLGTYAVTYSRTMIDVPGAGVTTGLPDMEAVFDPENLRPGWEDGTAIAIADLRFEDKPLGLCGRSALKQAIAGWQDMGFEPMIGIELEAYIYQRGADGEWEPYETPGAFVYGTGPFSDPEGLIKDIWDMAARCDLPIESINAEFDAPQFELTLKYADALKAADDAFLFRQMAREILFERGYLLSFMPKPFAEKSGSGMHFNFSLNDKDGNNVFGNDVASGQISEMMKGCIAGLLHHQEALAAILAPITNSYERLKPASLSGYWANWGIDHRSVSVRVSAETGSAARIEHRIADCAASPYFALAAMLQAALLGVKNGYECPEAETNDGIEMTNTNKHTPHSLPEAIDALVADDILCGAVGQEMIDNYVGIKRAEILELADKTVEEQINYYLLYV